MDNPASSTCDRLRIVHGVVDTGSAGSGRKLDRAVSMLNYGIANLEAQTGLTLFDRKGTREAVLTLAGLALLADAHGIGLGDV